MFKEDKSLSKVFLFSVSIFSVPRANSCISMEAPVLEGSWKSQLHGTCFSNHVNTTQPKCENDVLKWGPFFLPKLPLCSLSLLTLSINEHKAKFLPSVQSVYI